jgi:hypothetical protein
VVIDSPTSGREPFLRPLAEAVGYVVLEASQCEDTLGELVVLHRNAPDDPDLDWWTSGERLAKAVESLSDPDAGGMAAQYRGLLPQRHMIVHGLWLPGSSGNINMMRAKSTKSSPRGPEYEIGFGSDAALANLAADFNRLEQRAANAVSRYMRLA